MCKHIVNAFERSGLVHTTDLTFHGGEMSLILQKNLWESDGEGSLVGDLRTNILTLDHFPPKNAYYRMRVHLAVQVMSQQAITVLKDNADKCGVINEVQPMMSTIEKVDNIWNNTGISNRNIWKGYKMINSPNPLHVEEIFLILDVFSEWKKEAVENSNHCITWQSYEDLVWLVVGIVGTGKTYLKNDKSRTMVQRHKGSDCCENKFAECKERNSKPNIIQIRQSVVRRSGTRTSVFNLRNKSNTSGMKRIYYDELMGRMSKKV